MRRRRGRQFALIRADVKPMRWEPSVRTRYFTVTIALVVSSIGLIAGLSIWRLVGAEFASRVETQQLIAAALSRYTEQAILRHPREEPLQAVARDEATRLLLESSAREAKDFSYLAIVTADGLPLIPAVPAGGRDPARVTPLEEFQGRRWYRQLAEIWVADRVYELTTDFTVSNRPFVKFVAGVSSATLRARLRSSVRFQLVAALIVIGLALLLALLASNLVLRPLRELLLSIEFLEAESTAHGGGPGGEGAGDLQLVTHRLRELGRRFAGSRNEIEVMRDQMRKVVGSISERVVLLDRERRVILASPEAERLLSGSQAALRGRQLDDVLSRDHPLNLLTERAFALRQSLQELAAISSNGDEPRVMVASLQLFEDRGQPAGALLTLRDFESIQKLETQLDYATKLAELSRISSGVAHEVKNPLHAMVLHLELLRAKLESGLDPRPHVEILSSETHRLKRVVQTFLDFTRPVELTPHRMDANVLVHEVVLLAADARAQGVELVERYLAEPLWIQADGDLLKQAVLNIVINGCQAMPGGGRLHIATRRDAERLVQITIRDSGPGIPDGVREKIFNLYYTTKPEGNGIGLAQAFRAVQLHNGRISVECPAGGGTRFRITLPAA